MNISIPSQEEFITTYGEEDRTTVVMEELSELIKAASKLENLKEEIVDTLICIRIMQEITGITDSEIEEKVEEKHDRNLLLCRDVQS